MQCIFHKRSRERMERMSLKFGLIIFVILTFIHKAYGDHYEGAMIYWKQSVTDTNVVDIDYRQAWRRSAFTPECNDTTKQQGLLQDEGTPIAILSNSSNITRPFKFQCTDFSLTEDWTSGKGRVSFNPTATDSSSSVFIARFTGCCWVANISGLTSDSWSCIAVINTTIRSDTGQMNKSPRVDMPPIIRLQYGCNHTIKIRVSDDDGDDVRCRWANNKGRYDECGGVCGMFPHAVLDERACSITYGARYNLGLYAVAVQIEDFSSKTSKTSLSSIPLQFLVRIEHQSGNCVTYDKEKPQFIGLTLPDKACIGINNTTDFSTDIYIDSRSNSSIMELNSISPIGLVKSSLQRVNATGTWYVNIKWNPNKTDTINNVFCFTAVDTHGLSSDQRCVTMLAEVPPPVCIPSSKSPSKAVVSNTQHQWSIEFDQFASPATRPAFIYLHLANGNLVERVDVTSAPGVTYTNGTHGTVLRFSTATVLQEGQEYYLLFGQGLVQGHSYCGAESAAMLDQTFWSFRVVQMAMKEIIKVTCTASEWTVDVDMDKLRYRYPGSVATDIYMGDNSCRGNLVGNHLLFNYDIQSCLTSQSTMNDNLMFTNEMVYAFHDPALPFIIRSYNWTLDITCLVLRNLSTHSGIEYNQSTSVDATVSPVGAYQLKLALFTDPNYLNAIPDGAIKVPIGSQVYVKSYVDNVDWTIRMRLDTCFMLTSGAQDSGAYTILKYGCETDANTHVVSQSAHETRFVFSMFDLVTNHGGLFLHCDAIVCDTSDPTSLPACQRPCRTSGLSYALEGDYLKEMVIRSTTPGWIS